MKHKVAFYVLVNALVIVLTYEACGGGKNLGAGRAADVTPHEGLTSSTAASVVHQDLADGAPLPLAAGALSPKPSSPPEEAAAAPMVFVPSGSLASILEDLEEPWRPTPEGLFLRTTDLWSQEDFLRLTQARMRALLPLDDDLATLPESMDLRELIGSDLPTLEDCRAALQDEYTKGLLENLLVVEATFSELCETPEVNRNRDQRALLRRLKDQRDTAEDHLMRRLDATSSYRHWRLLSRLYLAWQQ